MSPQELEQVINQLNTASQNASQSTKDALPGVITSLRDLAQENDPQRLAAKAYGILSSNPGISDVGVAVCQVVMAHTDGPQVATEVGSQMVALRLQQTGPTAVGGFLRGGESVNGFSRQFIKQTSPDLENELGRRISVLKDTYRGEIESYSGKTKPLLDEIDTINQRINALVDGQINPNKNNPELSEQRKLELNAPLQNEVNELALRRGGLQQQIDNLATEREDLQIKLAKAMSQELATPPLTDTTKTYLRGLRDAVVNEPTFTNAFVEQGMGTLEQGNQALDKIALDLVNNNTSLRYVSPKISTDSEMGKHPIWTNSCQLAITSFNKVETDTLGVSEKISARVGTAVHTQEARQRVRDMHAGIRQAQAPQRMNLDLANEVSKLQTLKPYDDYLQKLEQRKQQLQTKPTFGDHFKAFFKHGLKGVQGEIEKTNLKIEAAKIAREDTATGVSMDLRREAVQRLKHNEAALELEIQQAKAVVVANTIEQGMNLTRTVTPEQLEGAFKQHDNLEPAKKEVGELIKTQEKALSVREKLGAQPHIPTEGPKKGIQV